MTNGLAKLKAKYPESFLIEYIEKTRSNEIVIGQEMKLCLDNLLNDLQDIQYQFDLTEERNRYAMVY